MLLLMQALAQTTVPCWEERRLAALDLNVVIAAVSALACLARVLAYVPNFVVMTFRGCKGRVGVFVGEVSLLCVWRRTAAENSS